MIEFHETMIENVDHDAIILAGGRSSRMGVPKQELQHHGDSLLRRAVAAVSSARRTVVAGPEAPGCDPATFVTEEPPFGGPVAGIAAALTELGSEPTDWVLILAVDHPELPAAVPALLAAAAGTSEDDPVDSLLVEHSGHREWLVGIHRRTGLERALRQFPQPHGLSIRRLFSQLEQRGVKVQADLGDVDTPADAQRFGIQAPR